MKKKRSSSIPNQTKLISKVGKELKKLDIKIPNNPIKMGSRTKQRILNRRISNGQKPLKKCSNSLHIKEMQIKTMLRYHFTPVRMTKIKNIIDSFYWRGCGVRRTLIHCWRECKIILQKQLCSWQHNL